MKRIAVTGGIAEGKSTVLGYVRQLGLETASADEIAREVFVDVEVQSLIARALRVQPPVSPAQVREAIGRDPSVRRLVNGITHPRIDRRIREHPAPVIEVPLLIEACLQGRYDRVWVVTCGPAEQLRRLTARLGSEEEASRLIRTQLPSSVKCAFADRIFRTNLPEEAVLRCVSEAMGREIG